MSITSGDFLLATLVVVGVYYLLPPRPQNVWLLLVSYAFVLTWAWEFAALLFSLTLVNFGLGHWLPGAGRYQRPLLWLGIGANLLTLGAFRLAGFFVEDLAAWWGHFGFSAQLGALVLLVPAGLAFYTLQNIAYLVDIYRGQLTPEPSLVNYALFLAYFPKLLAGPIERAQAFLPRLAQPRTVDNAQLRRSFGLLAVGAARKLLLADTLVATIPLHLWAEPRSVTMLELWLWLGVYAAYLYNDFAGYTSLVRGVSGLLGIELSPNFNAPVFARTFAEFWNRWHITLSRWLRDYVFYPLSRSLARRVRDRNHWVQLTLPPLATMLASGLWHGFSAHMLLWGGLHGLFLVAEQLPRRWRSVRPPDTWPRWRQALGVGVVGLLVTLAWVPFRLELPAALKFWQALFTWSGLAIQHRRLFVALALAGCGLAIDWAQVSTRGQVLSLRWPRLVPAGLTGLLLFAIWILMETDVPQPFVYQGF